MANEKRLIDANDLAGKVATSKYNNPHTNGRVKINHYNEHDHFIRMIMDAPTVDAIEVVRCKDCKHYDNSEGICWCKLNSKFFPGGMDWHGFPEDGFCSYGEKREV